MKMLLAYCVKSRKNNKEREGEIMKKWLWYLCLFNKSAKNSRRFRQTLVIAVFALVFFSLLSELVLAHSFAYYASTPTTPPVEFLWWWKYSMFLLVLGTYLPLRMSLKWSHLYSIFVALLWVAIFSVVLSVIGGMATGASTAPPPGLGPPCETY